jgi:hypothetical protein
MEKNQTLLLFQRVIEPDKPKLDSMLLDLHMLIMIGRRERTKEEYGTLLHATGFDMMKVVKTRSPICVI